MKVIKVNRCANCDYFGYTGFNSTGYVCTNRKVRLKNGNYRVLRRKLVIKGKLPSWCPLEDYKEADNETPV